MAQGNAWPPSKIKVWLGVALCCRQALSHCPHEEKGMEELLAQFRISNNAVYPFQARRQALFFAPYACGGTAGQASHGGLRANSLRL